MENFELLTQYSDFLTEQGSVSPILLTVLGFLGGLLSSVSPCVLGLLPVNLAYIGTAHIESKKEAFEKAGLFVVGVSLILTLLGLFGNFAFAVFTEHKGPINLGVGIFIVVMALFVSEIIRLPLPQFVKEMPEANPFVVGIIFAFISSPCASPVLFAVLTTASGAGSMIWSMIIMFAYSIGYTAIIFFASLSAGLIKQLHWFKEHNQLVLRTSGLLLAIMGLFYIWIGFKALS